MSRKIITPKEFEVCMPNEDVVFFRLAGDEVYLLGAFEDTEDSFRLNRYGKYGWEYSAKELEKSLTRDYITEVQGHHAGDMYIYDLDVNNILAEVRNCFGDNVVFYQSSENTIDFSFAKGLGLDEETVFCSL